MTDNKKEEIIKEYKETKKMLKSYKKSLLKLRSELKKLDKEIKELINQEAKYFIFDKLDSNYEKIEKILNRLNINKDYLLLKKEKYELKQTIRTYRLAKRYLERLQKYYKKLIKSLKKGDEINEQTSSRKG